MARDNKMDNARYQLGDIVRLKSENKKMTISDFAVMKVDKNGKRMKDGSGTEAFAGKYWCTWIDGGKRQECFFEEDLVLCGPDDFPASTPIDL